MADTPSPGSIEIKADEDWKERVRNEARQLDAAREPTPESRSTAPPPVHALTSDEPERHAGLTDEDLDYLPPAEFLTLVQMFSTQAIVALGLIPDPQSGRPQPRLKLAKHFIDLLGVLEDKTRGRLSAEEEQILTASLHELRMAYVEQTRRSAT